MSTDKVNIDVSHIRNFSIISHVDHGKTTLSDHLIAAGGMLPESLAGSMRALDFLPEEQKRGITIETSLASFLLKEADQNFLINLIDTPGHVDFSGKVAESLRLVDNGLILVDAVEGIMAQTKTVLKQAIKEKLKLVLFINKIDRLITELELGNNEIRLRIESIIGEIASFCMKYGYSKDEIPNFSKGTVILGSALEGWAIDIEFVKSGGSISQVINAYLGNSIDKLKNIKLSDTISRVLIHSFIDPLEGQQRKFPDLLTNEQNERVIQSLRECKAQNPPIVLIGRMYRASNSTIIGNIVRILSGTIKKGMKLKSSLTDEVVQISRIIQFRGRRQKNVDSGSAGSIYGIIFSSRIMTGDVLVDQKLRPILMDKISYVQDPIIAISIEPKNIKDISRLEGAIQSIVDITPGLEYEINPDTGELLASGVGTLQLDILAHDLKAMDFDIETSEPIILQFAMPTAHTQIEVERFGKFSIECGNTRTLEVGKSFLIINDSHENQLVFINRIDPEFEDGIIEVFKQSMRVSPLHKVKVKRFTLIIKAHGIEKKAMTYENGMIFGYGLIKDVMVKAGVAIHEPFYIIEIQVPEKYLGETLNELQRARAEIKNVETKHKDSFIRAELPIRTGLQIADTLRQATDGNAFWSFPEIIYKRIW